MPAPEKMIIEVQFYILVLKIVSHGCYKTTVKNTFSSGSPSCRNKNKLTS